MRTLALLVTTLAALSTARADVAVTTDAKPASVVETTPRFALAANLPIGWIDAKSVGISGYVGVTDNVAVRLNVASYKYGGWKTQEIIGGLIAGDGPDGSIGGRITDVGVGIVHYSRGLWDGFTVEAGALRRSYDTFSRDEYASDEYVQTKSATYAGRALFGWSFLIKNRVFIAGAIGASAGLESGSEEVQRTSGAMMTTRPVDRSDVSLEGYLRFGGAF